METKDLTFNEMRELVETQDYGMSQVFIPVAKLPSQRRFRRPCLLCQDTFTGEGAYCPTCEARCEVCGEAIDYSVDDGATTAAGTFHRSCFRDMNDRKESATEYGIDGVLQEVPEMPMTCLPFEPEPRAVMPVVMLSDEPVDYVARVDEARSYLQARIDATEQMFLRAAGTEKQAQAIVLADFQQIKAILEGTVGQ